MLSRVQEEGQQLVEALKSESVITILFCGILLLIAVILSFVISYVVYFYKH
jgi:hypothetical protein